MAAEVIIHLGLLTNRIVEAEIILHLGLWQAGLWQLR
jgi:hypothetical protein